MTMLLLVAVLWGVVTGIVPSWAWLSLSAIIALSPDRSLWWRVMIVVVVGELLLPMRVGELSLPLVASFGLVVVARRSMADVGMDEARGVIASGLVALGCVMLASMASRLVGSSVYGVSFWYAFSLRDIGLAWIAACCSVAAMWAISRATK